MTIPELVSAGWAAVLLNHLWQSTVVVGIAWLLALSLRSNQAGIRFWVWMAASVKFLLPFSFLIAAGEWIGSFFAAPVVVRPSLVGAMQQIEQPFPQPGYISASSPLAMTHRAGWVPVVLAAAWLCGVLLISIRFFRRWLLVRAAFRDASPLELGQGLPAFLTDAQIEPGVFGVLHPVLLLPRGMLDQLSGAQLDAIIAHEMCHVRRRDNLTFSLHMVVEALFWFHPAVWWIGERLVGEREHACDEAVIGAGARAETYAEGILNVCKYCVELPPSYVSGLAGSNLKSRIMHIMRNGMTHKLTMGRKALLGAAAIASLAVPLMLGMGRAPEMAADSMQQPAADKLPRFEVVSIKPYKAAATITGIRMTPDGVNITGMPLYMMVREAFGLPSDRVLNEPDWLKSERYDVAAKVNAADVARLAALEPEQRWAMMLPVLQDRCGLKFHHETRTLEVYALVAAKGGPKLKPSELATDGTPVKTADQFPQAVQPASASRASDGVTNKKLGQFFMRMSTQGMTMNANGVPIAGLVRLLSLQLGSTVVDKTDLTGKYDFTLTWTPDQAPAGMPERAVRGPAADGPVSTEVSGPSLFTAVQEQLGLKLIARKEPVDVVVIDSIEKPSPN